MRRFDVCACHGHVRGLVRHLTPRPHEGPVAERAYYATSSYIRIGRVRVMAVVILSIADFLGHERHLRQQLGAQFASHTNSIIINDRLIRSTRRYRSIS
jgi:hypothetical protein